MEIYMLCLRSKAFIFVCFFLTLFLFGCAKEPVRQRLLKSMVELDQEYVPALVFTNLHKQRESEIAMERLKEEWQRFYRDYYNLEIKYGEDITDKFWKEDFDQVNDLIASAEALAGEQKLSETHRKLRGVRLALRNIRRRNGINYFLDGMTGFHDSMEQISLILRGKDKLRDKDIEKLRALFKEAQANWFQLAGTEIDTVLLGFDSKKVDAVKKRVRYEEKMIAALAAALSSKDADRIFQATQDLKPNFMVLYKAFGDFQPIFDKIIKEKKALKGREITDEVGSE